MKTQLVYGDHMRLIIQLLLLMRWWSISSSCQCNGSFTIRFFTDLPANYRMNIYAVEQLKIDNTLKYVDSIVAVPDSTLRMTRYSAQQTTELPQFGNHMTPFVLRTRDSIFSKSSENVFSLNTDGNEFLRILSVAPLALQ